MQTEILEFRFPDGDFEFDTAEQVPEVGAVVTKNGRVWKVDAIERDIPTTVRLQPVPLDENGR
jgi:hypothetical protein